MIYILDFGSNFSGRSREIIVAIAVVVVVVVVVIVVIAVVAVIVVIAVVAVVIIIIIIVVVVIVITIIVVVVVAKEVVALGVHLRGEGSYLRWISRFYVHIFTAHWKILPVHSLYPF